MNDDMVYEIIEKYYINSNRKLNIIDTEQYECNVIGIIVKENTIEILVD